MDTIEIKVTVISQVHNGLDWLVSEQIRRVLQSKFILIRDSKLDFNFHSSRVAFLSVCGNVLQCDRRLVFGH